MKSSNGEPLDAYVRVRLTRSEAAAYREAAEAADEQCLSDWLRAAIEAGAGIAARRSGRRVGGKRARVFSTADPVLIANIAQVGSLLNQCARRLNTDFLNGSPANVVEALGALKNIEARTHALLPVPRLD
ncbi:hypothetical protein [Variovorax sp. V118]|uniref:hypothetical protein n=1 Tax=Variovorax sp. V118 TaxID=3065954 RepID=UPI0034E8B650